MYTNGNTNFSLDVVKGSGEGNRGLAAWDLRETACLCPPINMEDRKKLQTSYFQNINKVMRFNNN